MTASPEVEDRRGISAALRIAAGVMLLLLGCILALPFVPGPGIFVLLLGLWLLKDHFRWAKRALQWAQTKAERITSGRRSAKP